MGISLRPEHLKRYKDMALLLMKYGRGDLVKTSGLDEAIKDDDKTEEVNPDINNLPDDLERLGPTYVKLGQFLSTRSDMLPPEYLEALTRLQDKVETFPYQKVEEIITADLGIRFSKAFKEFDPKPIGSASIGQVHKAVLKDGRAVVVKVQRPDIREEMIKDLDALGDAAEFLEEHTEAGKMYMLEATLEEFRKMTIRELDYRNEAQNLKILSKNLEEFKNIVVPQPVEDFVSSRILTMEYIHGSNVTSLSPVRMLDADGYKLAEELFKAYLQQIVIDGFYHSDPHPGNVFITEDNKIALLDLGMVGYVSEKMQANLLQILIALGDGRGEDVAAYAMEIGEKAKVFDEGKFRNELAEVVARQKSLTLENLEIGTVILEVTKVCGRNGLRVPNELTMLGKTLLNLDKVGSTLAPKFDPNASIRRNANELLQKKLTQSAQSKKPYEILLEAKEFFEMLPVRVNKILEKLSNNDLEFKVDTIDEQYLMNGFQKVANRITVGLIIAALIIGAGLIMNVQSGFTIFGYPGIAIILFLIAAITGLVLAFRIMFTDEHMDKKG